MKVLVLAGGFDQIQLIKELKKRNNFVILADYYENPPAKEYADKHYQTSTLDEEAILKIAENEKVELIITACTDQALLTMAKVSEILKLPSYLSYKTALNVTNKLYMKDMFVKNNIPTSKYKIIHNVNEIEELDLKYPLVVKPCDCNSSKGVTKVEKKDDILGAVKESINLSRSSNAIIEEFLEGIELSIDVFVQENDVKILSITETKKIRNNQNNFTICQSTYPANITEIQEKEIEKIAKNISKVFGLKNSPILIQAIANKDKVNVLEFSARMGGGTKYKLIKTISGINIMEELVKMVLKEKNCINPKKMVKFAELDYCYCENGILDKLEGFEYLKNEQIILDYFQYKTKGMVIDQALNSGDRVAGYLIIAETKSELEEKKKKVMQKIKVYDKNGIDILKHDYEVK